MGYTKRVSLSLIFIFPPLRAPLAAVFARHLPLSECECAIEAPIRPPARIPRLHQFSDICVKAEFYSVILVIVSDCLVFLHPLGNRGAMGPCRISCSRVLPLLSSRGTCVYMLRLTHTYIYIYIYIYVGVCVPFASQHVLSLVLSLTHTHWRRVAVLHRYARGRITLPCGGLATAKYNTISVRQ